jgi:LysR family cys regulon transcriptional activator
VIDRFVKRYPQVHISLVQGNPTEICEAVDAGQADLAVGTETIRPFPNLVKLPSIPIDRSLVAREGHPILKAKSLTLKEIAKYPIIAHDRYRSGQWKIMSTFRQHGIEPRVLFDSVDADVSKTYVELGLGIAILASVAVDPKHDPELRARDVSHLFEASTSYISLRANSYLRGFVFDFIQMLDSGLKPEKVRAMLRGSRTGAPTAADRRG